MNNSSEQFLILLTAADDSSQDGMMIRPIVSFGLAPLVFIAFFELGCTPKTDRDQRSYAVGYRLGQQLTAVQNEIDPDMVARGLKDGIRQTPKLEVGVLAKRLEELQVKQNEVELGVSKQRLAEAVAFLASIKSKPGVRVLEEGILVEEKKQGQGVARALKPDDQIQVRYAAKTSTGQVIDVTNADEGVKIKFREINIPGLRTAIQKMPVGAEWIIYLAPDKAYGSSNRPGLPSQSAVVYDLSLIAVGPHK